VPNQSALAPFTFGDIVASFDSTTLERGRTYASDGHVLSATVAPSGAILGRVRGSRATPYNIVVHVARRYGSKRTLLHGSCDCPMLVDCKHVAAVLCSLLSANDAANSTGANGAPKLRVVASDPRVESWLQELREAVAGEQPSTGEEHIAYMLAKKRQPYDDRRLPVDAIVVRRLKSERLGKIRDCSPESLALGQARAIGPRDVLIGRLLRTYGDTYKARAALADDIFARVVATGRAYLDDLSSAPLTAGLDRQAQLVWETGSDGAQRPTLHCDGKPLEQLAAASSWYVDRENSQAGRIDAGVPASVLVKLLAAPPLVPDAALGVRRAFETELMRFALTAPALVEQRIVTVEPIPVLRLRTVDVPVPQWESGRYASGPSRIDIAEFSFAYGGIDVDPTSHADAVRALHDGVAVSHPRDTNAETRAAARLQRYPLIKDPVSKERASGSGLFLRFEPQDEGWWLEFVHHAVPELRSEGWRVDIDTTFRRKVVDLAGDAVWLPRFEERDGDWFDVGLGLDLGGRRIELLPLLRDLLNQRDSPLDSARLDDSDRPTFFVSFAEDGTTLAFPMARLRAIVRTLLELGDPDALTPNGRLQLPRTRANVLAELEAGSGLRWDVPERVRELGHALQSFTGIARVDVPASFAGTLRDYQRDGLDWLQFLRAYGFGGILADDMGLGKSVQTLAHLLCEKEAGRLEKPVLLVVPTSLVYHWRDEAERFTPTLRVLPLHGPDRARRFGDISTSDLVISTYALLPRDRALHERGWHALILDEAQNVKNPQAKAAQVAMRLKAAHRIGLTGTPVENHLGDLWSLFSIVLPGALGNRKLFGRLFRAPIEKHGDAERARRLAERIKPFLLRRTKETVARELPEKTEIVQRVELTGAQRDLYETVRAAMHERVRAEIADRGLARSQIVILDALLKLRQVCCDPRLLPPKLRGTAESAKLELLLDMLPQMIEEGRRILVFSQFTSMLALIEPALAELGIAHALLTGDTVDRRAAVKRFQSGDVPLFLISLRAGGTGLNLTAADTVVHYDPWWNPAVERQATDRAHRIGQTRHIFVYKLIGAGTVEEKIVELQARKAELAAAIFAQKSGTGAQFGAEDIERLFSPLE